MLVNQDTATYNRLENLLYDAGNADDLTEFHAHTTCSKCGGRPDDA